MGALLSRAGIRSLSASSAYLKYCCSLTPLLKNLRKPQHAKQPAVMEDMLPKLPELPQHVLMDIFSMLDLPDLIRAGSVCSFWRSAYTSLHSLGVYKRSQTPCLLYTSESAGDNVAFLYSLAEKRTYKLTLPEPPIRTRYIIGSSQGWLVTADESSEMHILNPISGQQIALPSVLTIVQVAPIFNDRGRICKHLSELRDCLYHKAFVFFDTSAGSYIVVLIHNPFRQLSFARLGDDKWTWLPQHSAFEDCIYKDGLLYAVTEFRQIYAFDLSGFEVTVDIIIDRAIDGIYERNYIVQAPWGDLLHVSRTDDIDGFDYDGFDYDADPLAFQRNTGNIKIHKVNTLAPQLVEVNSLDGYVLFLGQSQSLCLRAEQYRTIKGNHAYFTDDDHMSLHQYKNNRRDIGLLKLDDGNREELVSPQLWSNWPTPVWITPDLTRQDQINMR